MTEHIRKPNANTLGEIINANYSDFKVVGGSAPMDMDISHGAEIDKVTADYLHIYPYVKWSDGCYKPCHYWGADFYITLKRA